MSCTDVIAELEAFWEPEAGFLWQLRQGRFVESENRRLLAIISQIHADDETNFPRRLVSLLWYLPLFMAWQIPRVREAGGDAEACSRAVTEVTNELERILGVP